MSRKKKKNPCFRSHILCPRFEHNYFTKLDYVQKTGIDVKQFVLSYRPLHTFSRTLSCSMDANLVVDRRWAKYQIKLFTISQLLNLNKSHNGSLWLLIWIHSAGIKKYQPVKLITYCERFEPRSHFKSRFEFDRLGERGPE